MSQVSTVYVEGTIFSCFFFCLFVFFGHCTLTGHMERLLNPTRISVWERVQKKNVTRTPASLLISLAAAIVYKQLQLLFFVVFLCGVQAQRAAVTSCFCHNKSSLHRAPASFPSKHRDWLHNTKAASSRDSEWGSSSRLHEILGCGISAIEVHCRATYNQRCEKQI